MLFFSKNTSTDFTKLNQKEIQQMAINKFNDSIKLLNNSKYNDAQKSMSFYKKKINYSYFHKNDNRKTGHPLISIIIVAYDTNQFLLECIGSLENQSNPNFEIIIVDNGKNESIHKQLDTKKLLHIIVPQNFYPSEGRNIGNYFAKSDIVAFLDDDAFVSNNYIETILNAFETYDICGFRGKVLPKTKNRNNDPIGHYNLGNIPFPSIINTEGNCAFRKNVYDEFEGMNPLLFGHEGWEFSYKISVKYGNASMIYWPKTIIFHDYALSDKKLNIKNNRHRIMNDFIKKTYPKAKKYRNKMKVFINIENKIEIEKLIPRV